MNDDDRLLEPLIEESRDLHSDSMKTIRQPLDEMVETGQEARARGEVETVDLGPARAQQRDGLRRRVLGAGGAVAATGFGAALLGLFDTPAYAATSQAAPSKAGDIMILQTAASIEVLAVSTYKTALTLPYIGGSSANTVVATFARTTMGQHQDHLDAFNSAVSKLGGAKQTNPDPKYVPVVNRAVSSLTGKSAAQGTPAVVGLALTLENVAAETYTNDMAYLQDMNAKQIMASIMGIEAQHAATLMAVQALLSTPQLIVIPPNDAALPAAAGSVGFPSAFYSTASASPASEGAVK